MKTKNKKEEFIDYYNEMYNISGGCQKFCVVFDQIFGNTFAIAKVNFDYNVNISNNNAHIPTLILEIKKILKSF